ncbi:unnamed protein product [Trichogramma brassicae]|uniref:Uncharacterized protein n=1 Tax=Trichogramma brassicae TaxID=86971 RepID=A0A6H5I3A5_9HYME|nr:unnamed protein product [Trichogramma brassicae]
MAREKATTKRTNIFDSLFVQNNCKNIESNGKNQVKNQVKSQVKSQVNYQVKSHAKSSVELNFAMTFFAYSWFSSVTMTTQVVHFGSSRHAHNKFNFLKKVIAESGSLPRRRAGCATIDLAFELFAEDVGLASEDQLRSQNSTIYPHREQHLVAVLEKSIAEPLSRAEVVRDVRRYSWTICPVKKCRLHANSLKEEIVLTRFRAREYQTAVRDLLGTFCNLNRLLDYVKTPLEPSEYWWQLDEQLSQELDGIDTIFGNLLAPLSS